MKPGIGIADRVDVGSLVNLTTVPQQDDMATQVPEQLSQEFRHLACLEIVLPKLDVKTHASTLGCDSERPDGRDSVMPIVVTNNRGMAFRAPRPATRRDEHEATFIEEYDVGAKFSRFFLMRATCSASNE